MINSEGLSKQGEFAVSKDLLAAKEGMMEKNGVGDGNKEVEGSVDENSPGSSLTSIGYTSKASKTEAKYSAIGVIEKLESRIAESMKSHGPSDEDKELERELKREQIAAAKAQREYYERMGRAGN